MLKAGRFSSVLKLVKMPKIINKKRKIKQKLRGGGGGTYLLRIFLSSPGVAQLVEHRSETNRLWFNSRFRAHIWVVGSFPNWGMPHIEDNR